MGDQARPRGPNKVVEWRDTEDVTDKDIPRETLRTLRRIEELLKERRSK